MAHKKTIVDSSVWIAFFYEADSQHLEAKTLLEKTTGPIVVPEYILLEVLTILRLKREIEALQQFLALAMRKDVYLPSGTLGEEVAVYFANNDSRLSFVDTALLLLSAKYRVVTLDKALANAIKGYNK